MNQQGYKTQKLAAGEVDSCDLGGVILHVYKTHDPMNDVCLILEKRKKAVVIEAPCFHSNLTEFDRYLGESQLDIEGMILAYHMTGGGILKGVKRYSTKNAEDYGWRGRGKSAVKSFTKTFGAAFDPALSRVTDYIEGNSAVIAGITMNFEGNSDAFDIEIPEIKAKYIHMLGHDVHSIIESTVQADLEIAKLQECVKKGYDLIFTSHYPPETPRDVQEKIRYLEQIKNAFRAAKSAREFKQLVKKEFPAYAGENYLDITAQNLYRG
ncbi:MAG: hypothetical protein LBD31_05995 [Treponema sp.]|nr:hypothetical protein [Treponema sp.]